MLMSLRFGRALTAKKVSVRCWSEVEAVPKQNPVTTPEGSTAASKLKASYPPRLLDQPMSAYPASHPVPRRLASLTGIAELSNASPSAQYSCSLSSSKGPTGTLSASASSTVLAPLGT